MFRVRKAMTWSGKHYEIGDVVEIDEGHPRLRVLIQQSHYLEYANSSKPANEQGVAVQIIRS